MKLKYILPVCLIGTLNFHTYTQTIISGELRPRPEVRFGYRELPDTASKPVFIVSQRTRLNFSVKKEKLGAGISIQDVRIWGDEQLYSATGQQGDWASIDLKEAWLSFNFTKEFSVKAGRQEWKYGDQRLIGARNWAQSGISYDALLLSYKGNFRIDAGFSYNNNEDSYFRNYYAFDKFKTLNFFYAEKKIRDQVDLYALYVTTGMQHMIKTGGVHLKHTFGGSVTYHNDFLSLNGNGYYQTGRNRNDVEVSAFLLNGIAAITAGKLKLTAGADLISGNKDSTFNITDRRFDIFYGARHPYNGEMDLFTNLNNSTAGAGLIDVYLTPEYKITDKILAKVAFHYFRLHRSLPGFDPYLASEIDMKLTYKYNDELSVDLGYSFAQPSDSFYAIRIKNRVDRVPCQWGWMMITYKPVFYNQEK